MNLIACNRCSRLHPDFMACLHCGTMSTQQATAQEIEVAGIHAKMREIDEAAIRADERAKVEAEVITELRARVDWYREDAEAVNDHRLQDRAHIKREAIIEALTCIERGKHRSTP